MQAGRLLGCVRLSGYMDSIESLGDDGEGGTNILMDEPLMPEWFVASLPGIYIA